VIAMAKIAIVRVKGLYGIRPAAKTTLDSLRLFYINHCAVFEDSPSLRGMLQVAKDYICWGEVKEETLKAVMEKRENMLAKHNEMKNAKMQKTDAKTDMKEAKNAKSSSKTEPKPVKSEKRSSGMLFALHAPRGGWNGTIKKRFPKGAAGLRPDMDTLLELMS